MGTDELRVALQNLPGTTGVGKAWVRPHPQIFSVTVVYCHGAEDLSGGCEIHIQREFRFEYSPGCWQHPDERHGNAHDFIHLPFTPENVHGQSVFAMKIYNGVEVVQDV